MPEWGRERGLQDGHAQLRIRCLQHTRARGGRPSPPWALWPRQRTSLQTSGCRRRARRRKADLISTWLAVCATPSTSYRPGVGSGGGGAGGAARRALLWGRVGKGGEGWVVWRLAPAGSAGVVPPGSRQGPGRGGCERKAGHWRAVTWRAHSLCRSPQGAGAALAQGPWPRLLRLRRGARGRRPAATSWAPPVDAPRRRMARLPRLPPICMCSGPAERP
jgi:hypothetical protein